MAARYNRILIVVNPASTNASRAKRHIEQLRQQFSPSQCTIVETSSAGPTATIERLRQHAGLFGPDTVLCIAGGDGTANQLINWLLTDPTLPSAARKTVILPLWGGNANDLAYMLNGLSSRAHTKDILEYGQLVHIYPLEFRLKSASDTSTKLAACYASFGASAYAARRINRPAHRRKRSHAFLPTRLASELWAVIKAYIESPTFQIIRKGETTTVYEYILVNGSRVAKVDRIPLKLSDKAYYHASVRRKHPSILWYLYQVIRQHRYGQVASNKQTFVALQDIPAQCDGESFIVPEGTTVNVRIAKQPFTALSTKLPEAIAHMSSAPKRSRKYRLIRAAVVTMAILIVFHTYLHLTNPYASVNIVQQPYTTQVNNDSGEISYTQHYKTQVLTGPFWSLVGYYKSGFLIVQNRFFGSIKAPSPTSDGIIRDIHARRFDPAKPYSISGDQFSVLYVRNLGVFYNSTLNPETALDQTDWQNRQRLYLQSVLYGIDGIANGGPIRTTVVPVGPRQVAATQVHPGSVSSDSVYGLLYALYQLKTPRDSYPAGYQLQTTASAERILVEKRDALRQMVSTYQEEVQDPRTGLIKQGLDLAAARDGVTRDRSFYDNIVLWKTLQLADSMDIIDYGEQRLADMRNDIMRLYWDNDSGRFKDVLGDAGESQNYSSDWLLAMPTGFLDSRSPDDLDKILRTIAYTRANRIAEPFPIKYQAEANAQEAPWAVRTFVPNYGSNAIWSYWGAEYIKLLATAYHATGDESYKTEAQRHIATYRDKMEEYRGFPESFDAEGNFLQNAVYKSIRQTGWVVAFEDAIATLEKP